MEQKILLVEDSADDFALLNRAFSRCGMSEMIIWRKSGVDAVEFLTNQPPGLLLVVCDLKMPRMDGFELLSWIKTQPQLKSLPFVILTNSNEERDRLRARELGAASYLVKPSEFSRLAEIAQKLKEFIKA
jgi:CheY-like chemotaxis protein